MTRTIIHTKPAVGLPLEPVQPGLSYPTSGSALWVIGPTEPSHSLHCRFVCKPIILLPPAPSPCPWEFLVQWRRRGTALTECQGRKEEKGRVLALS